MTPDRGAQHLDRDLARWAEVLVVGGGPAGAVTASSLAQRNVRVVLVHHGPEGRPTLGEVLPPAARPTLDRLGLGAVLDDLAHRPSPGNVSAWGTGSAIETDHLFSPYGPGLHLDRAAFDAHLRNVAATSGARILARARGAWRGLASAAVPGRLRVVVDATGRASAVARTRGWSVDRRDALVAVVGVLTPRSVSADVDGRTFVTSVPDGWWYSALLPDGRRVAAFLTDRDLLDRRLWRDPLMWHDRLVDVPVIGSLVRASGAPPPARLLVAAADSRRVRGPALASDPGSPAASEGEPHIVAVGDAAMAFDPLSSLGILAAIQSADEAIAVITACLGGQRDAAIQAAGRRAGADETRWDRYTDRLVTAYRDERRWPDSPFWARRHAWQRPSRSASAARDL